jgi:hypothetical protein
MQTRNVGEFLKYAIPRNKSALLVGPPGIGKTDIVTSVAKDLGYDLVLSHAVVEDPTNYKGLGAIVDGKAVWLPFGNLRQIVETKKPTVFFLDDLGQAPQAVQSAIMQLVLSRRVDEHKVSDTVAFVAATNGKGHRAGVGNFLEPLKDRFTIIKVEPNVDDWINWALGNDMPAEMIAFIKYRPHFLTSWPQENDDQKTLTEKTAQLSKAAQTMGKIATPRGIARIGKHLVDGLPKNLEYDTFVGDTGEAFATEVLGFLKVFRSLPNPDLVLMHPETAEIPEDPATMYALCGALAHRASETSISRIVTYGNRLKDAFSVLLIQMAVGKDRQVVNTKAFINWAANHADVMFG